MSNPVAVVRQLPPFAWVALAAVAGVGFLVWHAYDSDAEDTSWTNPLNAPTPPEAAPLVMRPAAPAAHGCEPRPMGLSGAFRSRAYAGSLAESRTSIIGEWSA